MQDDQFAKENFSGVTKLFPLPSLVMFPHALQPLHLFEPRFRQMMADALEGDQVISMVLLRPGWHSEYEGNPPIEPVTCIGRIMAHTKLPDGRYTLLLRGVWRARILEELKTDKLYRSARVELLDDVGDGYETTLRGEVARAVLPTLDDANPARPQITDLIESEISLGTLCDILGFALPISLEYKQALLETVEVPARANMLIEALRPKPDRTFPPDFSVN